MTSVTRAPGLMPAAWTSHLREGAVARNFSWTSLLFFVGRLLNRQLHIAAGILVVLILAASTSATFAQTKAQQAADIFYPSLAKKFPPGRKTPCDKCKDEQKALNQLWDELSTYYGDYPDITAVQRAYNNEANAKSALAAAQKRGAATAAAVPAAQQAVDNARKASDEAEKKAGSPSANYLKSYLTLMDIRDKISKAAKKLEDCEKACGDQSAQPATETPPPPPPPPKGPQAPGGFPPVPDCTEPDFAQKKEQFLADLQRMREAVQKVLGNYSGGKE